MNIQDFVDALAGGYNADELKKMVDDAVELQSKQSKITEARDGLVEAASNYIELLTGESVTREENIRIKKHLMTIEKEIQKLSAKTRETKKDSFEDFLKGYKYF